MLTLQKFSKMFLCFALMFFTGAREGHSLMDNVFVEFADVILRQRVIYSWFGMFLIHLLLQFVTLEAGKWPSK